MSSFRLHQDLSPGWKRHNSASSARNMLLSLLLLPLFTYGLMRVVMPPSGIRRCFLVTDCPGSTRTTNSKCLLFLGKPLWLWPAWGGRKHTAANRKRYLAFPTGNDCGKSCSDLALLFHPHSQARTDKFCLWLFCTTLHRDNAEQSAWLTALVWNTGWELFPLYLQIKLKLCLQPRVATLDCLALLDLGWWHTLTLEESLQGKPLPKFSNPFATLGCTTPP